MRLCEIYLFNEAGIYPTYVADAALKIKFVYFDLADILGDDLDHFERIYARPDAVISEWPSYLVAIANAANNKGYKVASYVDKVTGNIAQKKNKMKAFLSPLNVLISDYNLKETINQDIASKFIFITSNPEAIKEVNEKRLLAVPFVKGKISYTLDGINNPGRLSVMSDLSPANMGMYPLSYGARGERTPGDDPRLHFIEKGKTYQIEQNDKDMLEQLYTRQMYGTPLTLQVPNRPDIKVPVFSPFAAEDKMHQTLIELMKKTNDPAQVSSRVNLAEMCGDLFVDFIDRYMRTKHLGLDYSVHVPQSSSTFASEIINGMTKSGKPPSGVYEYLKNTNPNTIIVNPAGVQQTADTYIIDILLDNLKGDNNNRRNLATKYQIESNARAINSYCYRKEQEHIQLLKDAERTGKQPPKDNISWHRSYVLTEKHNSKRDLNRRLVQDLILNQGELKIYATAYDKIKEEIYEKWRKQADKWAKKIITTKQLDPLLRRGNLLNTFLPAPNSPPIDDKELAVIIDDIATFGMTARNIAAKILEIKPTVSNIISLTAFNFGS